jgi:hypothetical protein
MEAQALATDAAIQKIGKSEKAIGDRDSLNAMQKAEQSLRNIDTTVKSTDRDYNTLSRTTRRLTHETGNLTRATRNLTVEKQRLGRAFHFLIHGTRMLFLPSILIAISTAIGGLAQGVAALAGGLIALMPKLTSLAGLVSPLPGLFFAFGLSMLTAKLAFSDLGKAMMGNEQALKRLTPAGREFLKVLKSYQPALQELRTSAQKGLFEGLTQGMSKVRTALPALNQVLAMMSGTLGQGAAGLGTYVTRSGFLRDFVALGREAAWTMTQVGHGFGAVFDALRNIMIVGRPFNRWLLSTVVGWAEMWKQATTGARASGRMAATFARWQKDLTTLGHILRNLWVIMGNLGRAARPLGEDLWQSADRVTKKWAEMTGTIQGQASLIRYFLSLRENIRAFNDILGKATLGLMKMGSQPGFRNMLRELEKFGPVIVDALNKMANVYGPPLMRVLAEFGRLLANLVTPNGPMLVFLRVVENVIDAFNWLFEHIPGLSGLIGTVFGLAAVSRFMGALGSLTLAWLGVAKAAGTAGAAQTAALTAPLGGGIFGGLFGGRGKGVPAVGQQLQIPGLATAAGAGLGARILARLGGVGGLGLMLGGTALQTAAPYTGGTGNALLGAGGNILTAAGAGWMLAGGNPMGALIGGTAMAGYEAYKNIPKLYKSLYGDSTKPAPIDKQIQDVLMGIGTDFPTMQAVKTPRYLEPQLHPEKYPGYYVGMSGTAQMKMTPAAFAATRAYVKSMQDAPKTLAQANTQLIFWENQRTRARRTLSPPRRTRLKGLIKRSRRGRF